MPFAICAILALAYLPLAARPAGVIRSVLKTLSVAGLSLVALWSGATGLSLALGLCALGDLLLSRDGDRAFMGGIVAFAAGHLVYIVLFLSDPASEPSRLGNAPTVWAVVGFAGVGLVMARVLAPRAGDLRGPVLAYIPIILGMGLAALSLPVSGTLTWALPSAMAFIASDILLAVDKFVMPDSHPASRITPFLVWSLYWGAQAGFLMAFT